MAAWLGTATQQVCELVPRLASECGIILSVSTLRHITRRLGYAWKRCRRLLKAQRDPLAFAAGQQPLPSLHHAEAPGKGAVYYARLPMVGSAIADPRLVEWLRRVGAG